MELFLCQWNGNGSTKDRSSGKWEHIECCDAVNNTALVFVLAVSDSSFCFALVLVDELVIFHWFLGTRLGFILALFYIFS